MVEADVSWESWSSPPVSRRRCPTWQSTAATPWPTAPPPSRPLHTSPPSSAAPSMLSGERSYRREQTKSQQCTVFCTLYSSGSGLSIQCGLVQVVLRIRRIRMFLGLLDPNPDLLVLYKGMDPDRILPSPSKNSKKNLDSYCFLTSFLNFYLWKMIQIYLLKVVISRKKKRLFIYFLLASWRSMTKRAGSGSASWSSSISQRHGSADPDPDPHQNVMDPQQCVTVQ
jgi:hypothetical protein